MNSSFNDVVSTGRSLWHQRYDVRGLMRAKGALNGLSSSGSYDYTLRLWNASDGRQLPG